MEQQLRRYFIGIISFGFVVTWIAVGTFAAFGGLVATVVATTGASALLDARRGRRSTAPARRPPQRRATPRTVNARPLRDEEIELPLVPDEPSLIIGVSN